LTVAYCLFVIVASGGTAVAINMALGLTTAPLFRIFLAFIKSVPPANGGGG
jgi:arginine:agmatine antiporter